MSHRPPRSGAGAAGARPSGRRPRGPQPRARRARRGFSLIEMLVAMTIFGVVIASAFGFLLQQGRGFRAMSARAEQVQNGRFGRDILRQEIRTAGTNVTDDQPVVVFASDSVFAFNADLTTNRQDGVAFTGAIYVDPYASDAEAAAMSSGRRISFPGTAFEYPLMDYTTNIGTLGDAETITYRFTRDTTSENPADHMLLRRVNDGVPEVIATGLRRSGSAPFFRYWYDPSRYDPAATALEQVPAGWLPLVKAVALRGVPPDTGTALTTRIDQVRAVEVTYEATRPQGGRHDVVRYMVPMPNTAAERQARACGRPPLAPPSPLPVWRADSSAVILTWARAVDDGAGEDDALRYVLWRRLGATGDWGAPIATIGAGNGALSYRYRDGGVQPGQALSYQYALAVQDCTPNVSGMSTSTAVLVP